MTTKGLLKDLAMAWLLLSGVVFVYGMAQGDLVALMLSLASVCGLVSAWGLGRTASQALGGQGSKAYHPGCQELERIENACVNVEARRFEVEARRASINDLIARVLGREPSLAPRFEHYSRSTAGQEDEVSTLNLRIDVLESYLRRLDRAEDALAASDLERAALEYERMGMVEKADVLRREGRSVPCPERPDGPRTLPKQGPAAGCWEKDGRR